MATMTIEKRQRGVFGWLALVVFWGFNLIMAIVVLKGLGSVSEAVNQAATEAQAAGARLGGGIALSVLLKIWLLGAGILGVLTLTTRGRKVTITKEI